jgi:uroporphyrinogen decarboxylase
MRQAGRYMKEFRDIRSKVSLLELCKTPSLACEVTVHAQEYLEVDAAIIFADILLPLDALGAGLDYVKGEGPVIARPVRSEADFKNLLDIDAAEALSYVMEAIKQTRQSLKPNIPLIGFASAPFTLASYLIEGGSSRNYENTKTMMYLRPDLWHALMNKLVDLSIDYLNAQAKAGAQALQVFDSWVGSLSPQDYKTYVLPHSKRLIQNLEKGYPVIHFGTGSSTLLPSMKEAGGDVIGLDWRVELAEAWDSLGEVAVQGNLDPCVVFAEKDYIREKSESILASVAGRAGHIFNLGHGVLPSMDPEKVKFLVDVVHSFKTEKN